MCTSDDLRKRQLECLRLAADCQYLAGEAETPELRSHFRRMADNWSDLADRDLEAGLTGLEPVGADSPRIWNTGAARHFDRR